MNYKIIADEDKLRAFIDWLPELESNEKYYLSLFSRKKYCESKIKSNDKTQLRRFTATKDRIFDKIKQLEIPLDAWRLKDIGAPQESLALYITLNPRCMKKATEKMGKKCWDLMKGENYNLHAEAMSCIQQSKSRTCFVDFDIDEKDIDIDRSWLDEVVGHGNYEIVETRGGYHLLVEPDKATRYRQEKYNDKNWYQLIQKKYPKEISIDQSGDQLMPVVGAVQGGFVPRFITND